MKISIIAGARPNFMKIAPIIHAFERDKISFRLIHTGQHYDDKLSGSFFEELDIPEPDINLEVGSGTQAEQTANVMVKFENELIQNPCDYVLLVGDVNSTLACAIVSKKMKIPVIHVEAGLRSRDHGMPEEINRLVVDSISDICFTTTEEASLQLKREGHDNDHVYFVGNVMIDSLVRNLDRFRKPELDVRQPYFVLTLHRPSNVDDPNVLIHNLQSISRSLDENVVVYFSVHPRTRKHLHKNNLPTNIIACDPLPYLEFMHLVKNSIGVITDSGGLQEETTFLGIPCLTLRENTERPETITLGTNILIGKSEKLLNENIKKILGDDWKRGEIPEKWDGNSARRISQILGKLMK